MANPIVVTTSLQFHCVADNIIFSHLTMDTSNESANQHPSETHVDHVPDPLVVHVPDFKDPA
jgi:hypothetical protein